MDHLALNQEHGREHAMLNSMVLEVFFKVCDFKDLTRFRLVCTSWRDASLKRFRDNAVLRITGNIGKSEDIPDKWLGVGDYDRILDMPGFATKPFRKYFVNLYPFIQSKPPTTSDYENFWCKIGARMLSLRISVNDEWWNASGMSNLLLKSTPNLRILIFDRYIEDWLKATAASDKVYTNLTTLNALGIPCSDIFSVFPNLKEIFLGEDSEHDLRDILSSLLKMNPKVSASIRVHLFTTSYIFVNAKNRYLLENLLGFPGVNMKALKLYRQVHNTAVELKEMIATAFKYSSEILETLILFDEYEGRYHDDPESYYGRYLLYDTILGEPRPLLRVLHVECRRVVGLQWLNDCLNVSKLGLSNINCWHFDSVQVGSLKMLRNLKKIEISSEIGHTLRDSDVRLISTFSPNLVSFSGELDNSSFRCLCSLLPGIRKLTLNLIKGPDDEGITGIIDHYGKVLDELFLTDEVVFQNLTNLKYLQKLTCYNGNLSDRSVYNGFLKMVHLKKLRVTLSSQTTDDALQALVQKFPTGLVRRCNS